MRRLVIRAYAVAALRRRPRRHGRTCRTDRHHDARGPADSQPGSPAASPPGMTPRPDSGAHPGAPPPAAHPGHSEPRSDRAEPAAIASHDAHDRPVLTLVRALAIQDSIQDSRRHSTTQNGTGRTGDGRFPRSDGTRRHWANACDPTLNPQVLGSTPRGRTKDLFSGGGRAVVGGFRTPIQEESVVFRHAASTDRRVAERTPWRNRGRTRSSASSSKISRASRPAPSWQSARDAAADTLRYARSRAGLSAAWSSCTWAPSLRCHEGLRPHSSNWSGKGPFG